MTRDDDDDDGTIPATTPADDHDNDAAAPLSVDNDDDDDDVLGPRRIQITPTSTTTRRCRRCWHPSVSMATRGER